MQELLFYFFIILAASILQTSTGFGFSVMATPFLLLLFTPQEAMQINIILSLVISFSLVWKVRHDIDVALLKKVMIGSVVGAPFGSLLFALVDVTTFKLLIAILLIGLTILLIKNLSIQQTGVEIMALVLYQVCSQQVLGWLDHHCYSILRAHIEIKKPLELFH